MNVPRTSSPLRFGRRGLTAGWVAVMLFGLCVPALWAEAVSREYRLKAAFLCEFARFVEWPSERFRDDGSALVIAVLGRNPFGEELVRLASLRGPDQRAIELRQIESMAESVDAHIVFIAADEEARLRFSPTILPGVLTVGESAGFAERGGVIRFLLVEDKVRLEINRSAGERAGLRLSGQLLKLATLVPQDAEEISP